MTSTNRRANERIQNALMELARQPGNDVCADCKSRSPRWASVNLGIFICLNCASIHRKLGTHITKVKSLSLDEWSKERVEFMRQNGNLKSNLLYNPDEARNPPPTNMVNTERDSELESFIRAKYESKRFMTKKSLPSSQQDAVVPPRRIASVSAKLSLTDPSQTPRNLGITEHKRSTAPPLQTQGDGEVRISSQPLALSSQSASAYQPKNAGKGEVWDELISLQGPTQNSSLPLQFQPFYSTSTPTTPLSTPLPQYLTPGMPTGASGSLSTITTPVTSSPSVGLSGIAVTSNPFGQQVACVTPSSFSPPQMPTSTIHSYPFPQHPTLTPPPFPVVSTPHTSAQFLTPFVTGQGLPSQQQQPFAAPQHAAYGTAAFVQQQTQFQFPMNGWQGSQPHHGF